MIVRLKTDILPTALVGKVK